jgi:hypothetical protein
MTVSEELVARFRRHGLCLECARAVAQAEAEGRDEFQTCGECTQILPLLIAGIQLARDKTDLTVDDIFRPFTDAAESSLMTGRTRNDWAGLYDAALVAVEYHRTTAADPITEMTRAFVRCHGTREQWLVIYDSMAQATDETDAEEEAAEVRARGRLN